MARGTTDSRDSELAHSFGPHEFGFDFLPLELPPADAPPLPRTPTPKVPVVDLAGDGPLPALDARNGEKAGQRHREAEASRSPGHAGRSTTPGQFWLDGDVILCACPDCRAPMSVRFWLMVADCWRCGTSIELTDEQEREVQRLLAERKRQQQTRSAPAAPPQASPPRPAAAAESRFRGAPAAASAPAPAPPATPASPSRALAPPPPAPAEAPPAAAPAIRPAPSLANLAPSAAARPRPIVQRRRPSLWRRVLSDTPAWLISMLVHLVLLTLLALLTMEDEPDEGNYITLSAMISRNVREGDDPLEIKPDDLAQFDLPLPAKADLNDDRKREALLAAAQDARELRLDDDPPPTLPDIAAIKDQIGRTDGFTAAVAARDPRLRVEMVTSEGGTTLTEAAVARGLRWLANHQNRDGSWSLDGFHRAGDCNCGGHGAFSAKAPGTALAMLPFLGAGQTHLAGKYKVTVGRGLAWLIENQGDDGDLRAGANGNEGMYTHGQATIVLCEAFAMTGDEALREPAQKAIDFIVQAQYHDGGWRYQPRPRSQRGDTSVVGWQLMALQSARAAQLRVPDETWGLADLYFDTVQHRDGALYSYQAHGSPTPAMTAEALLCRMYLGWTKDRPGLGEGVDWLLDEHLPSTSSPNIYYWYYATQTLHHFGGEAWETWNLKMRDVLVSTQETRGHEAGSWDPRGDHANAGGRIYMTALAVCTLEVYYRHLPIFRQIELDGP